MDDKPIDDSNVTFLDEWTAQRELTTLVKQKNKLRHPSQQLDPETCVVIRNGLGKAVLVLSQDEWATKTQGWRDFIGRQNYNVDPSTVTS